MALVERLMHWPTEPEADWISVHQFFAAQHEVMMGYLTTANVKTYLAMDAGDIADYDAMIANTPPANQKADRALYIERIHAVFILAEQRVTQYTTPAEVRTKLNIPQQ
jgi:hypothetical protein